MDARHVTLSRDPRSHAPRPPHSQVGDVAWTPWSSTAFAACTVDGKVHVFDLNENKSEAMCEQKVVRRAKLTKIAFNPKGTDTPVLLVGDDHGAAPPPARHPTPPEGPPHTRSPPLTPASLRPSGSVSCLKLSPNLRWTAVTKAEAERKAKEEAEAAAASGPRRGAAPRKAAADDDSAPADPFVLERMKSEKIAEAATKNIVD